MKRKLMDILACPIDKYYPLELHVFEEKGEIVEGMIICPKCLRWYPIREEIPEMLPDELREKREEIAFLKKWKDKIPQKILLEGIPFNLKDFLNWKDCFLDYLRFQIILISSIFVTYSKPTWRSLQASPIVLKSY